MRSSARAPGYDFFKLIVAVVLLLLYLYLFQRQVPPASMQPTQAAIFTSLALTSTLPSASPTETRASPTAESAPTSPQATSPTRTLAGSASATPIGTDRAPALTGTALSTATPSAVPARASAQATLVTGTPVEAAGPMPSTTMTNTPPPTILPTDTLAPLLSPTISPALETTATPVPGAPSDAEVCETATSRARLHIGRDATILRRLNFRSSPGIRNNWLFTNLPGTHVEVVGGPECIPHLWGAYLWWQIRLPDGRTGWSAEGSLFGSYYFMEPVE